MKERPILFSGEMVRAILEGRKTQTRRTLKQQPIDILPMNIPDEWVTLETRDPNHGRVIKCRHGVPGDRLWVRESFSFHNEMGIGKTHKTGISYKAGGYKSFSRPTEDSSFEKFNGEYDTWRPSIHMPRWASRITLEITGVRVERVQAISGADALAEGVWRPGPDADPDEVDRSYDAVTEYRKLWDELNDERGYSWASNPWVWVIEFRKVTP